MRGQSIKGLKKTLFPNRPFFIECILYGKQRVLNSKKKHLETTADRYLLLNCKRSRFISAKCFYRSPQNYPLFTSIFPFNLCTLFISLEYMTHIWTLLSKILSPIPFVNHLSFIIENNETSFQGLAQIGTDCVGLFTGVVQTRL